VTSLPDKDVNLSSQPYEARFLWIGGNSQP